MIAITFALPQESADLRAMLAHPGRILPPPLPAVIGTIGHQEVTVCHTGIGEKSATQQLRSLIKLQHPRGLISAGFAGGLDPKLQVGDLLIATNFADNRLLNVTRRVCDDGINSRCFFGTLSTQPCVAETSDSKLLLAQRTHASAVDMETAAIAAACKNLSLPMLSVRAISDIATKSLPVPFPVWFDPDKQKPRPAALVRFLVRHPSCIRPFICFVKDIRFARQRLTEYLVKLIAEL